MMNVTNGMTPADLAAVLRDNDGFDGNGSWIWIFIILAIFGGLGNNWDRNGVQDGYVLASDFSNLSRQISDGFGGVEKGVDSIRNGLCDGFYTNAQLINGTNMNMADGFARAELARANNQTALLQQLNANNITAMQNHNAMQAQLSDCCCQNRYDALQNTYVLQKSIDNGFCQTNFNGVQNTRDIIEGQNNNTHAILAKLTEMENNAKDDKIANLMADNQALRFAQSQTMQNSYIVNQLKPPAPVPAYVVANPFCNCNYNTVNGTAIA